MTEGNSAYPLISRIVMLLVGSVGMVYVFVQIALPQFRQDLDLANVFVLFVVAMISCFGIWLSLCWREYSLNELEAMKTAVSTPSFPSVPEHAIECRFHVFNKSAAIFWIPFLVKFILRAAMCHESC